MMGMTEPSARFRWALSQIEVQPNCRVLEIGCGHGVMLTELTAHLTTGSIVGLDRSAKMIAASRVRNAEAIAAGRVVLHQAELASADLGDRRFDLAFAINVRLFGEEADADYAVLKRHLAPGGHLYLLFETPSAAHQSRFDAGVARNFAKHGFSLRRGDGGGLGVCLIGTLAAAKPS